MKGNHPSFIGIGAQKAGTSWLYKKLSPLPSFSLPPKKELHYFDRSTQYPSPNLLSEERLAYRLVNIKWTARALRHLFRLYADKEIEEAKWYKNYYYSNYHDDWYKSLFKNCEGITGEITPAYSILTEADIKEMHQTLGDVKIIFMVRDPVERAWSSFKYHYKLKISLLTERECSLWENYVNSNYQTMRSNYIQTIDNYVRVFGEGKLLLGFYDAIIDQPDILLKQIVNHLGGEESEVDYLANINERINSSKSIPIPKTVYQQLVDIYQPMVETLSQRYGGYFEKWCDSYLNKENSKPYSPTLIL